MISKRTQEDLPAHFLHPALAQSCPIQQNFTLQKNTKCKLYSLYPLQMLQLNFVVGRWDLQVGAESGTVPVSGDWRGRRVLYIQPAALTSMQALRPVWKLDKYRDDKAV